MTDIKEHCHHRSACLLTTSTRCQSQVSPMWKRAVAINGLQNYCFWWNCPNYFGIFLILFLCVQCSVCSVRLPHAKDAKAAEIFLLCVLCGLCAMIASRESRKLRKDFFYFAGSVCSVWWLSHAKDAKDAEIFLLRVLCVVAHSSRMTILPSFETNVLFLYRML